MRPILLRICNTILFLFIASEVFPAILTDSKLLYFNDFDDNEFFDSGVECEIQGSKNTFESVQQLNGIGDGRFTFSGLFLRNASSGQSTDVSKRTTFVFTNLPSHSSVSIAFLLGILDSWDADTTHGPDRFVIEVDGTQVFNEVFSLYENLSYQEGPGTAELLSTDVKLGFGSWAENAWNFFTETDIQDIAHSASTLTIRIYAYGPSWGGGTNESWGVDDFRVTYKTTPTTGSSTVIRLATVLPTFLNQ